MLKPECRSPVHAVVSHRDTQATLCAWVFFPVIDCHLDGECAKALRAPQPVLQRLPFHFGSVELVLLFFGNIAAEFRC
jgi:hypothetical protein